VSGQIEQKDFRAVGGRLNLWRGVAGGPAGFEVCLEGIELFLQRRDDPSVCGYGEGIIPPC